MEKEEPKRWPSVLDDGRRDHLIEGVVFALGGRCNVHGGAADLVLLEAGLQQTGHLGLLQTINTQRRDLEAIAAMIDRRR